MNRKHLQNSSKSKAWIIGTIWANIVIVGLFLGIILLILGGPIIQLFSETAGVVLIWLITTSGLIYATRLGVKSVLKEAIINPKEIIKISAGVTLLPIILQIGLIMYGYFHFAIWPELTTYIEFTFANIILFLATYLWLKKLSQTILS